MGCRLELEGTVFEPDVLLPDFLERGIRQIDWMKSGGMAGCLTENGMD